MPVIEIKNLQKYYGKHIGTKNVSFSVDKGELFGFVGPNGAGKSTTIKTLLGFIFADSGTATICGLDVVACSKEIKTFTGYVPSDVRLYPDLSVSELFKRNGNFYQNSEYSVEVKRLTKLLELDVSKRFQELSTGNKKKVSLILALACQPTVLILDEPTSGLDPIVQKKLFDELKKQTANGVTVLLSSHNLAEVQEYCNRVAFINAGEIITVTNLREIQPQKIVSLRGGNLHFINPENVLTQTEDNFVFRFSGTTYDLLDLLQRIQPIDFTVQNESIEDRFLSLYEKGEIK